MTPSISPALIAEISACLEVVEDYTRRIDDAAVEYYTTGKKLFPNLSRAEDEQVAEQCTRAMARLEAASPDDVVAWHQIKYPINQYDEHIERSRDYWIRRRNLLRAIRSALRVRLELEQRTTADRTLPASNESGHHLEQGGKHVTKILFLGANPTGTTQLALTQEVQAIKNHLRSSQHANQFQVEQEWAVKLSDLNASLLRHRPDIVHFSGHGSNAGELVLESESGAPATVNPAALANLFKILKRNIRCVVLNACFSAPQAEAIAQHIDCVVGMTTAVGDKGAIEFAWAFYEAIGFNASVQDAFDLGRNQVDLNRLPDKDVPKLISRDGVKPQEVYLLNPQ